MTGKFGNEGNLQKYKKHYLIVEHFAWYMIRYENHWHDSCHSGRVTREMDITRGLFPKKHLINNFISMNELMFRSLGM